jgi:hypothetical protein
MKAEGLTLEELQAQFAEFCVFALRQNYRVTPEIVSELGLLDTDSLAKIVLHAVDGMNIRAVLDEMQQRDDLESAFDGEKKALADAPLITSA